MPADGNISLGDRGDRTDRLEPQLPLRPSGDGGAAAGGDAEPTPGLEPALPRSLPPAELLRGVRATLAAMPSRPRSPAQAEMISDLLIGLMHDRDADVRGEAARLMGELGRWAGPSAAFRLVMLLRDRMLCEVGPKDGEPDPPAPAGHAPAPREGRRRRRMLTSVNAAAADALSRIGTPALPALTSALGDRDADVRRLAAEALGAVRLGASSALPELYRLSSDSDYRVAEAAREAVRRIRGYS